jgi:hypothetical protein
MAKRSLRLLVETGEVCRCLRAKTMFYEPLDVGDSAASGSDIAECSGLNGPFWCAMTQGIQGPDGKFASIENCHAGCDRDCCETA